MTDIPIFHAPPGWETRRINILLVGCGGTGSELLSALAKTSFALRDLGHPGFHVTVFDADAVERPNLGRSNFYPCDLGHNKAQVTVQRINLAWGFAWDACPVHFDPTPESYRDLREKPDLVITCVDKGQFRADMAKLGRLVGGDRALYLDAGNDSHSGQVIIGHWAGIGGGDRHGFAREAEFVANVLDLYPNLDGFHEPPDEPSCSMADALRKQDLPINRSIANTAIELLWGLMRHGIGHQGCFVDIRKGEKIPMPVVSQVVCWLISANP